MIALALLCVIALLWWPLPPKQTLTLCLTAIILILVGEEIAYPVTFNAFSLGTVSLITWLEIIYVVLIRRFSRPHRLLAYNQKVLGLLLINVFVWLPLLFKQGEQPFWLNQQIIIWALVVNGIVTLGLLIFWTFIIALQGLARPLAADYLVVLGAGLHNGAVPPVLAERLNQAISCWQLNTDARIIVTGGILRNENISEAQAMKEYLVERGVPSAAVILEDRALNTWQNLKNCAQIIHQQNLQRVKVVVITSSFHVLRTRNYLHRLGFEWIIVPSNTPWSLQPLTVTRDYLGIIRDHYRSWIILLIIIGVLAEFIEFK